MPLNGQPETAGPQERDQFLLDIPALEPQRRKLHIAGHIIEMRDPKEIGLRQTSRLVNAFRHVDLAGLQQPGMGKPEDYDEIFNLLDMIFEIAFIDPEGNPGIPDAVLEKIAETDQITIAFAFINDFFGVSQAQAEKAAKEVIQTDSEEQDLEAELDAIVESIGEDRFLDSDSGTADPPTTG